MKKGFTVPLLLLVITGVVQAKGWKDITPLHSTCEDVKRAFGVDRCTLPMSSYTLPDFRVTVFFSKNQNCNTDARDWRVPVGTVTSLTVSPKKGMLPSELGIDVAKYKSLGSGDLVGTEGYVSPEDGVEVHLFKGFIEYVLFYPPSNEENLRCQPSSMAKVGHAFIALEDSSDLSQIWLSVQPQTKVPLRIPSVPTLEGKSLYAIIESVLPSAYEIQFAFTPDCVKSVCHYGKISGRLIEHGDARPQGKKVVLAKGRVGYLVRGRCNSRCLDSTVTWDEGAYRYTVALKGGTLRALKEHANSALSMSKEL